MELLDLSQTLGLETLGPIGDWKPRLKYYIKACNLRLNTNFKYWNSGLSSDLEGWNLNPTVGSRTCLRL